MLYIIFKGDELKPDMFTGMESDDKNLNIFPVFNVNQAHIYKSLYTAKSDARIIAQQYAVPVKILEITNTAVIDL